MSLDLDAIRARRDAYIESHSHPGAFACCTAHASADDVPAILAEVERLRAIESPVRALEDRNGDVWVLDVHPPRYKRDHYSSPMPRDFIEKHYGPVVEVGS